MFYFVSLFVSPSLYLFPFGKVLRYVYKRIANIVNIYIDGNNVQVE